jgi:hypothetical protein
MSLVAITSLSEVSGSTWVVTWASTSAAAYYIWHRGRRIAVVPGTTLSYTVIDTNGIPVIEVADAVTDVPVHYDSPGEVVLVWYTPTAGASRYQVYDVDLSRVVATVWEGGNIYHEWSSGWLGDGAAVHYQIIPLDAYGNEGVAVEFESVLVTTPQAARVTFSYDSSAGTIDVEAA